VKLNRIQTSAQPASSRLSGLQKPAEAGWIGDVLNRPTMLKHGACLMGEIHGCRLFYSERGYFFSIENYEGEAKLMDYFLAMEIIH